MIIYWVHSLLHSSISQFLQILTFYFNFYNFILDYYYWLRCIPMHTHVHTCGCACATVFIWSSEDSFQLLVCSFHSVSQVPNSVYQTWMTSTSSCWPISRVMEWNLTMVFWLILTWSLICCPSKQLFLVVFAHYSDLMIMNLCTLCYGKFSLCIIVMSRFTEHSKSILTIIVFNNMWYVIPCPLGFWFSITMYATVLVGYLCMLPGALFPNSQCFFFLLQA